jgi:hypothetical protein
MGNDWREPQSCRHGCGLTITEEALLMRLLIFLLLWPLTAQAATYWVNPSASGQHCTSSASDPGPGNSSQTINQGNGCLSAGDTLMVKPGTYNEGLVNAKGGGSEGGRITYKSEIDLGAVLVPPPDAGVVWQAGQNYATFDGFVIDASQTGYGFGVTGTHIRIMNTEVKNSQREGVTSSAGANGNDSIFLELINMHVHHNGTDINSCTDQGNGQFSGECHGAYLSASDTVIDGGRWHDNASMALHLYRSPNNITVKNATIYDNGYMHSGWGGTGIGGFFGSGHVYYNNVIYNNRKQGIWVDAPNIQVYNNTVVGNPESGFFNSSNSVTARNNILWNNGDNASGTNLGTWSHNLIGVNPLFLSESQHDYRLQSDSPARDVGFNLAFLFTTDIEGKDRVLPFDIGAYEFGGEPPPPPQPVGLVGEWKLDEGSGTTAVNTAEATLGTQNGALNSVGWTIPGIIGAADLATNGARWVTITPSATMRAITNEFGLSGWWRGTGAGGGELGCDLFSDGNSRAARIESNGRLTCFFYNGTNWTGVTAGSGNLFDGNAHHWSCSLQSGVDGLRARMDNASVGQLSTSNTVSFTLGPQAFIGRHGDGGIEYHCGTGTIGNVYVFDQYISDSGNTNLFQELLPTGGVSGIHVQWRADDPPATIQGSLDTPITWTIGNTLIQEWYISNNSGAPVVAHYPQFCSRNGGAFVQVSNTSQATLGVGVATSTNANMGDSVIPAQNFGLTPVDGRAVVDTVSESLTTLPHGGVTAWRYYMAFGGVAQANDTYRCKPRKPFSSPVDLDHYFDDVATSIPLITLQSPAAIGAGVKSGGAQQGGKQQ